MTFFRCGSFAKASCRFSGSYVQVHQKPSCDSPPHEMASTQPAENAIKLSSLTQWSQEHIQSIFESPSNEESIQAVDETFSSDIKATLNGKQIGLPEIKQLVLSMRAESPRGLRVDWNHSVEAPQDGYNNRVFFVRTPPRPRPKFLTFVL
jgi:hypothetical protein